MVCEHEIDRDAKKNLMSSQVFSNFFFLFLESFALHKKRVVSPKDASILAMGQGQGVPSEPLVGTFKSPLLIVLDFEQHLLR